MDSDGDGEDADDDFTAVSDGTSNNNDFKKKANKLATSHSTKKVLRNACVQQ